MSVADKDVIFELNKLILEQTNDLWLMSSALIIFQMVLVAHLLTAMRSEVRTSLIAWILLASMVCHALALMFGYFAKGALIEIMIDYSKDGAWQFDGTAKVMNFLQMLFVTCGLATFVTAFFFYSKALARAIAEWSKS